VRTILQHLKDNSVHAWELIPQLDAKRRDAALLSRVLDQAADVVRCKASIGGLLSAGQDLHAAEQIQYGRQLLQQEEIRGLVALSAVEPQLSQYEALVVANLGSELMEVFLDFHAQQQHHHHKTRVPELVRGLELCRALAPTAVLYGNRLNDVIRMTVRTTVGEFAEETATNAATTVKAGVTSMTLERFLDCLDMLFEQLVTLLKASVAVKDFCAKEGISMQPHESGDDLTVQIVTSAAELSCKSISELLRLRKDAHSLVTLEEMKRLWDVCMSFTTQFENLTDCKATGLRSTLLAQAKAFVERKHESNMSSLVAALESERWTQCDVSAERQDALTRLCLGRSLMPSSTKVIYATDYATTNTGEASGAKKKMADAEVEGVRYKVVWSCLLLVEMVMTDMACAAHFKALATNMVGKVAELLRLFNSRSTQLVLGAGAIHSAARLKSINAKHLSLVTQCVGLIISILPHVRAALMAQLPSKQHTLLNDLDTIKREYEEHNEKVLNKFVNIIGGIVEHGLAPRIGNTNFDDRANEQTLDGTIACCVFLEGISTNTRKMHQVLSSLLPPDHLQDSFSRIFAYLDQKLPELFLAAAVGNPPTKPPTFSLPSTDEGKKRMLLEVKTTTQNLNELAGVRPWDFSAVGVLEQELDYKLLEAPPLTEGDETRVSDTAERETNGKSKQNEEPFIEDRAENDSGDSRRYTTCEKIDEDKVNGGSDPSPEEANGEGESHSNDTFEENGHSGDAESASVGDNSCSAVKASTITKDSAVNGEGEGNGVTEPKEFSSTARVEER
jgi:vacuolar protein sorting-associated protein 54